MSLYFSFSLFRDLFKLGFVDLLEKKVFFCMGLAAMLMKIQFALDLLCISAVFIDISW